MWWLSESQSDFYPCSLADGITWFITERTAWLLRSLFFRETVYLPMLSSELYCVSGTHFKWSLCSFKVEHNVVCFLRMEKDWPVYLLSFCNLRSLAVGKRCSSECSGCTDPIYCFRLSKFGLWSQLLHGWFCSVCSVHDTGICIWGRCSPVPVLPLVLALSPCLFTKNLDMALLICVSNYLED